MAGPYVPQFEIYWKKLDPENTGKVLFVFFVVKKHLNEFKYGILTGGSHGCCTIPQALRPLRPDSGKGWEITKWNCEGVGGGGVDLQSYLCYWANNQILANIHNGYFSIESVSRSGAIKGKGLKFGISTALMMTDTAERAYAGVIQEVSDHY